MPTNKCKLEKLLKLQPTYIDCIAIYTDQAEVYTMRQKAMDAGWTITGEEVITTTKKEITIEGGIIKDENAQK